MKKQCSELFENIFDSGCGGCIRTCECGITYFDGQHGWDWEEGELEDLREKAKREPKKYIELDCSVGTMSINGIEIVYGCTCDLAKRYEQFIINHASQIAEYLNKTAIELREKADSITVKQP